MHVYNRALEITEAVISNNVTDRAAAIHTVIALHEEGLLASDYWHRPTRDADQAEQTKPRPPPDHDTTGPHDTPYTPNNTTGVGYTP